MLGLLAIVVDDDPLVRGLAAHILRRAGMACLGFASADDALPALAELGGDVSVLVTDVQMPGSMDGLGLARHVGEMHAGLPVIVMSGTPEALAIAASLPSVVAVLEKPFIPAELARLTVHACGGERPSRAERVLHRSMT